MPILFQYTKMFEKFKTYCQGRSMDLWRCNKDDLVAYLQKIYNDTASVSTVYQNLSAVSYFYRLKGLESPCASAFIAMYMKGLKRQVCLKKLLNFP